MMRSALVCSTVGVAMGIGGIPGIPGIPGGPGVPPTPPTPPTPPAASTNPVPISRNGAALPALNELPSGLDSADGPIGSFGVLPEFLKASTPFVPTSTFREDQGFKLDCQTMTGGETFPCAYYVVFQHCGSCTEDTNGGLPATLAVEPGTSFERACSPRFTPAGTLDESYPTAFFKVMVPRGESLDVFMDRDATAFAVFDGTNSQCENLLSNACQARNDCVEPMSGGCMNADTVCPPRVHRGPFPQGGNCPSCWEGGR
eukprot:TRINITY_DN746_c3_g1_i1.p1 TRINITY_DN746_c3_g1~~TRINITY_DN746_c3_g1_i1.p1  ORF type:complete len:258 (+),score=61.78 TRINITY_DN746_c3_g1_i1:80-853(+)